MSTAVKERVAKEKGEERKDKSYGEKLQRKKGKTKIKRKKCEKGRGQVEKGAK